MAGTVITVTSGKGGVGKTTTVANVAGALALTGKRVIAVDGDIGLRNLDLVLGVENLIIYDLVDVVEQRCRLEEALVRDGRARSLYLLPAAQTRNKQDVSPEQMVALCQELRQIADYVLIDSPAGIEHGFQNVVAPADRILIVTTPDVSALRDADKVIYLLERDWQRHPGLILNRYNHLIGVVPEDGELALTTDRGTPAVYNQRMRVSQAYRNIAQRIMGNNVPLMGFQQPGFWAKVWKWFRR
jgi:septum site-determining protein MinD